MDIEIRKLTPELAEAYVHFFDVTPHDDGTAKEELPCYCVTWRSDASYGMDGRHWFPTREERRERALQYVREGSIQGYLAFSSDEIVGWCNASADCRIGVDYLRSFWPIGESSAHVKGKSVFCFAIAPNVQRMGVATRLLERVCADAAKDGFDYVEAYVHKEFDAVPHDFRGPLAMYEKCGFTIWAEREGKAVMRKRLREKSNRQWLFTETIDGKEAWARLFQSINAFGPLVLEIFRKHRLVPGEVQNLTPGTNAVFRVGDKVVKVFAPVESGYSTDKDYEIELAALRHANRVEVSAPFLVCSGCIEDKYLFWYIVMEHIRGYEFEDVLERFDHRQKVAFATKMKTITHRLNVELLDGGIPPLTLRDCMDNPRWQAFPECFRLSRNAYLENQHLSDCVYTHGDMTGENIIVGDDGDVFLIDFADSRLAPYHYEWPPLVFALFGCDAVMMEAYFGDYRHDGFYDMLTLSMAIHEFGGPLVQQICELSGVATGTITDMSRLRALLGKSITGGHMKVR